MKKAIITGITGQDGYYLKELLLSKGYEVHGIMRKDSSQNFTEIHGSNSNRSLILHKCDLLDSEGWIKLLETIVPDEIYNLASQSHVRNSFNMAEYTCNITGLGPLRILEAIKHLGLIEKVKFYQASSSEMFGQILESPQTEKTSFYPRSPYGCAKVMAHHLTVNYREFYNIYACAGILFNHESPKRNEAFVTRKITKGASRIKLGLQDSLLLGDLSAKRDWGYAGDYVQAMWLMLQQDKARDFVIASGEVHSVEEFVEKAFNILELDWRQYVKCSLQDLRPSENNILRGDSSKIQQELGWKPIFSFEELIKLMVEADYELARQEALQLQ